MSSFASSIRSQYKTLKKQIAYNKKNTTNELPFPKNATSSQIDEYNAKYKKLHGVTPSPVEIKIPVLIKEKEEDIQINQKESISLRRKNTEGSTIPILYDQWETLYQVLLAEHEAKSKLSSANTSNNVETLKEETESSNEAVLSSQEVKEPEDLDTLVGELISRHPPQEISSIEELFSKFSFQEVSVIKKLITSLGLESENNTSSQEVEESEDLNKLVPSIEELMNYLELENGDNTIEKDTKDFILSRHDISDFQIN